MKLRSTERSAKILIDFLGHTPTGKVLDLGAGDCSLGILLDSGVEYHPVDNNLRNVSLRYHPHHWDLNKLPMPLKDNSFDYVFASMILEHVFRPYDLLREIKRVMKDNGILIIAVPDENALISRFQAPFRKYKHLGIQYYGHHYDFTVTNVVEMLTESGLKIIKFAGRFGFTSKYLIGIAPAVLFKCTK